MRTNATSSTHVRRRATKPTTNDREEKVFPPKARHGRQGGESFPSQAPLTSRRRMFFLPKHATDVKEEKVFPPKCHSRQGGEDFSSRSVETISPHCPKWSAHSINQRYISTYMENEWINNNTGTVNVYTQQSIHSDDLRQSQYYKLKYILMCKGKHIQCS